MALGLPWRSTHILRHSYATGALMATRDLSSVQASLGHASSRMTERYAKVIAMLDRGTAEKTAKFFDIFNTKKYQNGIFFRQFFENHLQNHLQSKIGS